VIVTFNAKDYELFLRPGCWEKAAIRFEELGSLDVKKDQVFKAISLS